MAPGADRAKRQAGQAERHGSHDVLQRRDYAAEDLESQTAGVECRKDRHILDEAPGAYKDIDRVMAHANDLVETVATLRQVVCVKG